MVLWPPASYVEVRRSITPPLYRACLVGTLLLGGELAFDGPRFSTLRDMRRPFRRHAAWPKLLFTLKGYFSTRPAWCARGSITEKGHGYYPLLRRYIIAGCDTSFSQTLAIV